MPTMPPRRLFGEEEFNAVRQVFERAWERGVDFGYQGEFETLYAEEFSAFQGGGYADAVCTGTASVLVALAGLDLPAGCEVMVSPVTDPGGVSPVIALGHTLTVADSEPDSFNIGPDEFEAALTDKTKAAIITHMGGLPARMDEIMEIASKRGVKVVEDCSQAHGASYKGHKVGTFGDIAAFSTMFSKNHASGGCGGLVFTKDQATYERVRSVADRGKDFFRSDFDPKDPAQGLMSSLNLNQDELSCAIGRSTLKKLPQIKARRTAIAKALEQGLDAIPGLNVLKPLPDADPSYFFLTVRVDENELGMDKVAFTDRLSAEGVWLNPDYKFTTQDWPWIKPSVTGNLATPNAKAFRAGSFNLLYHENFGDEHADYVISSARKAQGKEGE